MDNLLHPKRLIIDYLNKLDQLLWDLRERSNRRATMSMTCEDARDLRALCNDIQAAIDCARATPPPPDRSRTPLDLVYNEIKNIKRSVRNDSILAGKSIRLSTPLNELRKTIRACIDWLEPWQPTLKGLDLGTYNDRLRRLSETGKPPLRPCEHDAYEAYQLARNYAESPISTDRDAFEWIKANLKIIKDQIPHFVLPVAVETWARYLRSARNKYGDQKKGVVAERRRSKSHKSSQTDQ